MPEPVKHHPEYWTARGRCWAYCLGCGWHTPTTVSGNQVWAQLLFAEHLLAVANA